MKELANFKIFLDDNDNFDIVEIFQYVIDNGGYELFKAMTSFSNFKHEHVLNKMYLLALYSHLKLYRSVPHLNEIIAILRVPENEVCPVRLSPYLLVTPDTAELFKHYNVVGFNPLFDKICTILTSGSSPVFRFMSTEECASILKFAESEFMRKVIRYPYSKEQLSYDELHAKDGWFTLADLRIMSYLVSERILHDNNYFRYLTKATEYMYTKLDTISKLTDFGYDSIDLNVPVIINKTVSNHIDTLKYIISNTKVSQLTKEIIEDESLLEDELYPLYIEMLCMKYNDRISPEILEVLTIQYCLDFKEDFYLNIVFKNNELEEQVFGSDKLTSFNYIKLAINNKTIKSLDEVLEGVL